MRLLAALLALAVPLAHGQGAGGTVELLGQLGGRTAVMTLHETPRADGSARLTGEYLILPTLQLRYLETLTVIAADWPSALLPIARACSRATGLRFCGMMLLDCTNPSASRR